MRALHLLLPALVMACGPKEPPAPPVVAPPPVPAYRTTQPGPLAERPFTLPTSQEATLSNGLRVVLVEEHEVPLVYVHLTSTMGSWTDPDNKPKLASATLDMLNEGAGGRDAAALSTALRTLGATLNTGASKDGSSISLDVMKKNLEPALDLMADVIIRPEFPKADWDLMRKKRLASLSESRESASGMAARAWNHMLYGDSYIGRLSTDAGYAAISTRDMKKWWSIHIVPQHSILLVGGDITLEEAVPMLEARFGKWKGPRRVAKHDAPSADALPTFEESTIFLVDKPEAPQSVVRGGLFVGKKTDADWPAFNLANMAIGGQFSARINMNLREDKGWTYGARSGVRHGYLPGLWSASGNIVTPHTAEAVAEIIKEINEAREARLVTDKELSAARGALLGTWPLEFENPGYLLGETAEMWRYDLPDDWLSGRIARYRAVTLDQANAAFQAHVDPAKMVFVIVGDAAVIKEPLAALGLPVVMIDADGRPVQ
jgi:zinc protease